MRRTGTLIVILLTLVAGCGDPIQQSGATPWEISISPAAGERWSGEITIDRATGKISAPGFNDLIDRSSPSWAGATDTAAAELLGLNGPFDGRPKIYMLQETEQDKAVVTATITHLGDDSVDAERYRVVFTRGRDGRYRFASGERTFKCQSGRGHQDFDASPCS
ncbi:hypothetical protein [Rhizomonospora bruguierae]|uniref:hypothetical protein n=1 Tax=Rhizomonospora bruguierae TaxID=1581705 RepID=UPI001BCE0F1E|nr:hypothetical protein [Micromonospora sp. NBRC 107566]